MQTFLPYPDFAASAAVLDPKRLGKQRVETIQVLRALTRETYGWKHHPVVKMWRGYEEALTRYGLDMCAVWTVAGRADTCAVTLVADYAAFLERADISGVRSQHELASARELPPWLGDQAVHRSHRSALRRKDPVLYDTVFPDVPDDLPYVWPVSDR